MRNLGVFQLEIKVRNWQNRFSPEEESAGELYAKPWLILAL